ncbi:hypothetical protein SUGI_0837750 [Cryptomeria japonica]|uniref:uncharacterized protein LOC131079482 n=1 Tax=Cryptomeria japonica TaxID=3369 RepID=UPI002414A589|nr:uncharacterized protein LOC131079482 [Cryptomeria japonica]GLJ40584.1 hypothetical protein SUGI_0837750 [Cryptomeria japonica]
MEFLKTVFQSQDVLVKGLVREPRLLICNSEKTLKPSLAFWKGWGFCGAELVNFLKVNPAVLLHTSLTPARVDLIHKIFPDNKGKMFKYIVNAATISCMETLEAKIENLKLCGLSTEETWQLLRASPHVIFRSKEDVSEKMSILVNKMELPATYVMQHPRLLNISLEKTMKPRCVVWQKIKSIDDSDLSLSRVLSMPEARFVRKIIKGHPESKTLLKIYENAISDASNCKKSSTKA